MNTLKTTWKAYVKENDPSAADMAAYQILKAVKSKSNDKFAVAKALIDRAFTPITKESRLNNGHAPYQGAYEAIRCILNKYVRSSAFLNQFEETLNELEKEAFVEIHKGLLNEFNNGFEKHEPEYMFFFVRQDLSPEQQLVQTAHVALVAGQRMFSPEANTREIYFCVIGVENQEELVRAADLLNDHGISLQGFREPDLGNSLTAICSAPILRHKKGFLSHYKTLKFA